MAGDPVSLPAAATGGQSVPGAAAADTAAAAGNGCKNCWIHHAPVVKGVTAIERLLDSVGTWLSSLPANRITDFLSAGLWLVRRTVFPAGTGVGMWGSAACVATKDCSGVDLQGASFIAEDLQNVNFAGANVKGADFTMADLSRADFAGATIDRRTIFYGANLFNTNLTGLDLSNRDFSDANLYAADLTDTNLRYSNLEGANLRSAVLVRADLENTYLRKANLLFADLTDASLFNANLIDADLTYATLRGVRWGNTRCPNGWITHTGCSAG